MRWVLFALFLAAGLAAVWHATGPKAGAIEADIDRRAEAALAPLATHPLDVATDGRDVTLSGLADTAEERARLVAAAAGVTGARVVHDALEVLPLAEPYLFTAVKAADGTLTLGGTMPSAALQAAIAAKAGGLAGAGTVVDTMTLASGAPGGGWGGMAEAALAGLAPLVSGEARISGRGGLLAGSAPDVAGLAAAEAALAGAPDMAWETDLRLALGPDAPFALDAAKPPEGAVTLSGHAPDAAARERLLEAAARIGTGAPVGDLLIAEPAPPEGWTERAAAALELLGALRTGFLEIRGDAVRLKGEIGTDPEADALRARAAEGWTLELVVLRPDPPAGLKLRLAEGAGPSVEGILPRGVPPKLVAEALPGASIDGLATEGRGEQVAWENALIGLAAVAPRFREAEVTVAGAAIVVRGVLLRGFNAEEARSALRGAAGPAWTVTFEVSEAPPEAVLAVVLSPRGLDVAGILPAGLEVSEIAEVLDLDGTALDGLGGGGEGDAAVFRDAVAAIGRLAPLVREMEARLKGSEFAVRAVLRPGYGAGEAAARAEVPGLEPVLELAETEAGPGDRRVNLETGAAEAWSSGYWLPELDFEPAPDTCTEEAAAAFGAGTITFVTGSAEIDAEAEALLNRLAAIALRCLGDGSGGARLVVGGHTDDVGDARDNAALSRARAEAVVAALAARGVAGGAMLAVGYGALEPVADNATEEGRARNRRISFAFTDRAG